MTATAIVRAALAGTGVEMIASCGVDAYDARAPADYQSALMLAGARGLVVAASAGPLLWRRFRERTRNHPGWWDQPNPYDAFVAEALLLADSALASAGVRYRRFEAAFHAPLRVNFLALAEAVGLGTPGPFGLLIHPEHGPWWALRGAWLVDGDVEGPQAAGAPCAGCAAPCVGGWEHAGAQIGDTTPEHRLRCPVGVSSRYDDDQIAYHYDREATLKRLRR
jgi:epoxyqueuosine reductase QueG